MVGAGSSGLITLKVLLDTFPSANIACFEKGYSVRGCWGDQRADFVSTSTKYTTQFSCFRQWSAETSPQQDYADFFRGAEFGDYLEAFAERFSLKPHIRFGTTLQRLERLGETWTLTLSSNGKVSNQRFDAVFLCTGLVNQPVPLESTHVPIAEDPEGVRDATVVVVGGGESATDIANYLAKAEHNNRVFLSLRSGVRVSPRYHPIRGVPSDFLRNRLLLSFAKSVRNAVGEAFVTFRIRFDRMLAKWFPRQHASPQSTAPTKALRRAWDLKLKSRAKGRLFNVFHNKGDDFLDAVEEGRLNIIGPPTDARWLEYFDFDKATTLRISPDILVASTGYRSRLGELSGGSLQLKDFYRGCVHIGTNSLFLIGFARPIIGNIPSISEMQVRYAAGVLAGTYHVPTNLDKVHAATWQAHCREYPSLDTNNVYPVEQFPYCDALAREMGTLPTLANVGSLGLWLKIMVVPASTTHYVDEYFDAEGLERQKIYTPPFLTAIMLLFRLLEIPFCLLKQALKRLKL